MCWGSSPDSPPEQTTHWREQGNVLVNMYLFIKFIDYIIDMKERKSTSCLH